MVLNAKSPNKAAAMTFLRLVAFQSPCRPYLAEHAGYPAVPELT